MTSAMEKAGKSARTYFRLFGAKGALTRALVGVGAVSNEFKASIPHSSDKILLRLGTTDVAAFEHVFIDDEYGFALAPPPAIIVDAGANVGMSAVYFCLKYPSAKVIAIEPEPTNFAVLSRNAEMFPNIVPMQAALWNCEAGLRMEDGGGGHWGMRTVDANGPGKATVRSTTLQKLIEDHHIEHIDLLKIDVEGAEWEIFKDSTAWIGRVGVICAELHDRFRPGCSNVFGTATADFPIRWRRGELHCVAREGLIAAR